MNREEELIAENEALRVQLREMALDVLAASGQAQEAYEAQLAAEAEAARLRAEAENIAAQRDEAIRRRDAWKAKAEGYDEIAAAVRAKIKAEPATLSRILLKGALIEAERRVSQLESEIACIRAEQKEQQS